MIQYKNIINFKKMNYSIDEYALFMENTGIFDLLSNHLIANLYDYILGVEVGLDTNTRKKIEQGKQWKHWWKVIFYKVVLLKKRIILRR